MIHGTIRLLRSISEKLREVR